MSEVAQAGDEPQLLAVGEVERHLVQAEPFREPLLQALAQPRQVALFEQLAAELAQRPPLGEGAAVLQPLDARAHPPLGGHQHGRDGEAGDEGERRPRQALLHGQAARDGEVEEREREHAEQQRRGVGDGAAQDELHVPQPEAQQRPGEGERHQHQRCGRGCRGPSGQLQVQQRRQAVEGDERQVAAGEAEHHPLQLPPLLPAVPSPQLPDEGDEGGEREDGEEAELQAVEGGERLLAQAAEEPAAAVEDEVRLQRHERRRGHVEERHQAPQAPAQHRHREDQEEMERQRRQ